jgi:hypothetical protein
MSFHRGTSTDYLDLTERLREIATSTHVETAAISAAGTGYTAGDILAVAGGTALQTAQLEVRTVGGSGEITSIHVYNAGAYTAAPTLSGNAATGGTGTGATFTLTTEVGGWSVLARSQEIASAAVVAGGTGYVVGDIVTVLGGATRFDVQLEVLAESGGAVTSLGIVAGARGLYTNAPTAGTQTSGGSGSGLTVTLTLQDSTEEVDLLLEGDAGSSIPPRCAVCTYSDRLDQTEANTVFNWALFSFTEFQSSQPIHLQPNVSPGFDSGFGNGLIDDNANGTGAFVPLKDADAFPIQWWARVTGRSIIMQIKVEGPTTTHYPIAAFGLLNPAGTTQELPYPAFVLGSSDRSKAWYRDTLSIWGGLPEVLRRTNGPGFAFAPEADWVTFCTGTIGGNQSTIVSQNAGTSSPRGVLTPLGQPSPPTGSDVAFSSSNNFDGLTITQVNTASTIIRTPDSGGDLFPLYRMHVVQANSSGGGSDRFFGELDGVFWFHTGDDLVSPEDRFARAGEPIRSVFSAGTRTEPYSLYALDEA